MLFVVLFSRGDVAAAFAAGDKAMALNPYEMLTVAEYGGRLITTGEIERGMAMLRRAGELRRGPAVLASLLHVPRQLSPRRHAADAAHHAGQITADDYSFGHLAKALAAAANWATSGGRPASGRPARVRSQPSWRDDPRGELGQDHSQPEIVDRLARDLAAARLGGRPACAPVGVDLAKRPALAQ